MGIDKSIHAGLLLTTFAKEVPNFPYYPRQIWFDLSYKRLYIYPAGKFGCEGWMSITSFLDYAGQK